MDTDIHMPLIACHLPCSRHVCPSLSGLGKEVGQHMELGAGWARISMKMQGTPSGRMHYGSHLVFLTQVHACVIIGFCYRLFIRLN